MPIRHNLPAYVRMGRTAAGKPWRLRPHRPARFARPVSSRLLISVLSCLFLLPLGTAIVQAAPNPAARAAAAKPAAEAGRRTMAELSKPRVVVVSEHTQKLAGIKTAALTSATLRRTLRGYGTVLGPERLSQLRERYSTDRAKVATTRARLRYAGEEYHRLRILYAKGRDISQKDLQAARTNWRSAKAALGAAQTVLRERQARISQQWGPVLADWLYHSSTSFAQLMHQQMLLVRITLPPGKSLPSAPRTAVIETPGAASVTASLVSPAPDTDPRIQGLSFFYATGGKVGLLPGMNVSAQLAVGPELKGVILPEAAIVWWHENPWAYVRTGTERFQRRLVQEAVPVPGGWFVRHGFAPGERLAVVGTQLLLSEEFQSLIRGGD